MTEAWSIEQWNALRARTDEYVLAAATARLAEERIGVAGRSILRSFSSSFFLVTRFLPKVKRNAVNVIYAAVRYPDEIVDSFPIPQVEKGRRLDDWQSSYERALVSTEIRDAVRCGIPWILAGFAELVKRYEIPPQHYRAFLAAMRRDVSPAPFESLTQLIDEYVYGSAVVVGYFLAHIYGTAPGVNMADAYSSASDLAIALQLTNFARDVAEDHRRGRLYIPLDILAEDGLDLENIPALQRSISVLAQQAEDRYASAARTTDVFAPDTRTAISACIGVYRKLNRRLMGPEANPFERQTVPVAEKLKALPASKYWRLPLAYLGGI